jgi:fused signal recognition particle receptor
MGFFDKIKQGLKKTTEAVSDQLGSLVAVFQQVDEDFLEELEEALILADLGSKTAMEAVDELRKRAKRQKIESKEELVTAIQEILSEKMVDDTEMRLETKPSVILVIGVNGVGKTTTIGKLAYRYGQEGKNVILGAADTFRAAAAEQLAIWAKRAGADIVKHGGGADPASVVYDTIQAAKAREVDVIIIDTAGRLHNKANLMNELAKIDRVIERELPDASRETLLVLDATTGQNAVSQAEQFNKAAQISGIVLTKLDGTAKGGIVVAISGGLQIPVKFVGVGEGMEDLMPFNKEEFMTALLPGDLAQSDEQEETDG